ncbi:hypothetical protein Mapa_004476 [Marchantia paleacea]|nr:hypothetical protein Mapa_004476 [Marchantia paleacea]
MSISLYANIETHGVSSYIHSRFRTIRETITHSTWFIYSCTGHRTICTTFCERFTSTRSSDHRVHLQTSKVSR